MTEIQFSFNGRQIRARQGQSLASALAEAGQLALRKTAKGEDRGLFCGMGVCQECLVRVNGVPNLRACMTRAAEGLAVTRQDPFPQLADIPVQAPSPELIRVDPEVLVIGGGAAGLSAAIAARRAGASVVVLDERKIGGGQYYKQSADAAVLDAQQAEGADLLAQARERGAEILVGVELWGAFDDLLFLGHQDGVPLVARPRTAIVATGAYERPVMVPGWTLPGVMTTGAAQTLWRSDRTLPGKRIAVCGSGPLNLQVALELARGGAEVRLVAEAAPTPLAHAKDAIALARADPQLARKGLAMLLGLKARGVAVRHRTQLDRVIEGPTGLLAHFRGPGGRSRVEEVDALCMNAGFEPQNEILRLMGARMRYDAAFGHLKTERNETFETTVTNLFAVGDCAGLGGAPAACIEGRIAGRVAAARAGHGNVGDLTAERGDLARHRRFQHSLWRMHRIGPEPAKTIPPETLICRCEEITAGQLRAGLSDAPGHIGTLKRATRVGMGRCQGRYCAPVAARLVAEQTGKPLEDLSFFAPRVPIKPVSIATILATQEALDAPD
ncbi:MAG: FAD-dependent oxidoreductase [Pseudomonadota bacterium]